MWFLNLCSFVIRQMIRVFFKCRYTGVPSSWKWSPSDSFWHLLSIFQRKNKTKQAKKPYKKLLTSSNTDKKPLLWVFPVLLVWEHLMLQNKHKHSCKWPQNVSAGERFPTACFAEDNLPALYKRILLSSGIWEKIQWPHHLPSSSLLAVCRWKAA